MQIAKRGFTLIELLVVIVIIAILAAVIFVALDPVTRFAQARNARRWNDVNNLLTAVHEYIVDTNGFLPAGLSTGMVETQLGSEPTAICGDCGASASCVNLSAPLAKYMAQIPRDPSTGSAAETRYSVRVDANGIVWVRSCDPELSGTVIGVAR